MKFSFDAESYRKDLAEELKEKRSVDKDVAKELLEKERETLRYRVAEDIHKVLTNIEKQKKTLGETNSSFDEREKKSNEGQEISCETIKFEGSDGVEHELEIRISDIRDRIPEEINLFFDITRLFAIDAQSNGIGIGTYRDIYGNFKGKGGERKVLPNKNAAFDSHLFSRDLDLLDKLLTINKEDKWFFTKLIHPDFFPSDDEDEFVIENPYENPDLAPILNERLSDDEKKRLSAILDYKRSIIYNQSYLNTIDKLTDGAFTNPEMLCHFVAGDLVESTHKENPELMARFPHTPGSIVPTRNRREYVYTDNNQQDVTLQEIPFDVKKQVFTHLWTTAGGSTSYSNENLIAIFCDPKKERFRKEVQTVHAYDDGGGHKLRDRVRDLKDTGVLPQDADMIDGATKYTYMNGSGGVNFVFKKEEPWVYLADWIVDLYHGRLYKITEKTE